MTRVYAPLRLLILASFCALGVACGKEASAPGASSPKVSEAVTSIVVSPLAVEAQGGGKEVIISAKEAVDVWLNSAAFASEGWSENHEKAVARYRVIFQGAGGPQRSFYLGTIAGSKVEYKCFGLCATWWVAPALDDGSQDPNKVRVMSDAVWHPLAREWYLGSK